MNRPLFAFLLLGAVLAGPATSWAAPEPRTAAAALTVSAVSPEAAELPVRIAANGNIAAWQEASIGSESNGLQLADVRVNVGDVVKKGEVLAVFAAETVEADRAETRATVAEAEARLAEATANVKRARDLQAKGFVSPQKVTEFETLESTAAARLEAQKAVLRARQLRVDKTRVLAPDGGVISARSAAVGAVLPAGQELFRLIRQGRLEWRAEVAAAELAKIRPGMAVRLLPAGAAAGSEIAGRVRMVAPTVDPQTRNGLVYVDLPQGKEASPSARAGMFARGEFEAGRVRSLTLPQSAVVLREGFSYVLRIGADARVTQVKVGTGRRSGDRIEITDGLDANAKVVASGGAFLADGDTVRVVDAPAAKSGR
ncbi:MAG: efflux RND transporter periplasmic adaptor subunit [Rhodocyclaceae bacterium]|nr:efflux RND transporter periplasmic adaptor subunit [Rhodocyclaceae bacterium]